MERRSIQRFQILAVLGDGGMGTVFRARDPQLERDVAIKVLHAKGAPIRSALTTHDTVDLRGGPQKREDLLQEARMMAQLSHPNVVPIFEVGLDEAGDVFVVMEYVAGMDLRQWLKAAPRRTFEISRVFAQAARGLAAAHERGIVHRDFKPDNVLIGIDGRARVTDFGLSKLDEPTGLVRTAKVAGTPKYMAPELWRGEAATVASDVYALCAACLEALGEDATEPVRVLLENGLAKIPSERPPVAKVIAALEGPSPRLRARSLAAMAVGALVLGGGVALALSSNEDGPSCATDPSLLADRWDAAKRAAMRETLGPATAADVDRLLAIFDRRASEISTRTREVCEARHAGQLTVGQAQQQTACLELRAVELGVIADEQLAAKTNIVKAEIRFNRASLPSSCAVLAVHARDPRALASLYMRFYQSYELPAEKALVELAAIETAARAAGDPELAVKAAVNLGNRQRNTDQLAASDETLQRAYTEAISIGSSDAATIAVAERILILHNSRDLAQTKTLGTLALDLAAKPTTTPRARLRLARASGLAAATRGDERGSIELLRKALAEADQTEQRDLDLEALVRINLAEAMLLLDDNIPQAIVIAREAVELTRQEGERTNNHGIALNILSKAYMLQHDLPEALDYRRRALAVFTSIFPAEHSAVIEARVDLGVLLGHASQLEAAHEELADATELARKTGKLTRMLPWMLSRLAVATAQLGRTDEAIKQFEQALDLMAATLGTDHPQTFNQRFNYAATLLEVGRLDDAKRVIDLLEQTTTRRTEPRDKLSALLRGWLASDLARERGRPKEAEALARDAIAELTELGAHKEVALAQQRLGEALVAQGRFEEARAVLEPAFASARSQKLRADDQAAFEIALAAAEHGLGKHAEARARAERLQLVLERYPGAHSARAKVERLLAAKR
ncbi:MAG: serine/threonine-protein kinase [Myxococcota bacterium]|nr:serine/threonine-protein kinase [Myxococcota bacterium]